MPITRQLTIASVLGCALLLAACGESGEESSSSMEDASSGATGRYITELSVQEFMNSVLDPMADELWETAGWVNDREEGYFELYPENDEEWEQARQGAAMIVEAGNMLALPPRSPDDDAWLTYANGMSEVGLQAMDAAAAQDEDAWFEAGARLYSVCSACHQAYSPEVSTRFTSN